MLLFGSFLLLYINLNNWIADWGESLSISVYIEDGLGAEEKENIKSVLLELKGAEIKGFISKEKALENLRDGLGEHSGLLYGMKNNPLPGSFEVVFQDMKDALIDPKSVKKSLEQLDGVDEVQYSEQWIERFEGILYVFKVVGFIVGGLLCIAILFITSNTIKLTIYSRREEIEIYKLVGATDWFIKIPFLIEGAIQGILSGAAAFVILLIVFSVFSIKNLSLFGLPVLVMKFLPKELAIFVVLLSLILGFIGGLIAIGRFFRLQNLE
jgi:cell division transport system permease protein